MSEPTRPPVTTWVKTSADMAKRDADEKVNGIIDHMCQQLIKEGVSHLDITLFRSHAKTMTWSELLVAHEIFWNSRHAYAAFMRNEFYSFIGISALFCLLMPQYFIGVLVIWAASTIKYFSKTRNIRQRILAAGIMYFGGVGMLLHAAYNVLFG
jgi:hypothetical protein